MAPQYFVVGMPKSGTSSIAQFFRCGGYRVSHQTCGSQTCARCIWNNLQDGRAILHGCDQYDVYTQLDEDGLGQDHFCFFPQLNLTRLHQAYPSSTFILNVRNPIHWVDSVNDWNSLRTRLSRCHLGSYNLQEDGQLVAFYRAHNEYVRAFAHASGHRLLEVDIEGNGSALAVHTNIHPSCYAQVNANVREKKHKLCFVGDSLVRYLWCWHERRTIQHCTGHTDLSGNASTFYFKPTVAEVLRGTYRACNAIIWDNLFHEARANPALFHTPSQRLKALQRVHAALVASSRRVIFYASQKPTSVFAQERHGNVSMAEAWGVDHALLQHNLTRWLTIRADRYPTDGQVDGRHYGEAGIRDLYKLLSDTYL